MIPFNSLDEELAALLKERGIQEVDLHNHSSDLYIGCKSLADAHYIGFGDSKGNKRRWRACASTFKAQKGSDMDKYPVCLEIYFAAMNYDFNQKHQYHVRHIN